MLATEHDVIQDWVDEAIADFVDERRRHRRHPFLRIVTVRYADGLGDQVVAVCRDISKAGIGLVHRAPLEVGHVQLAIPTGRTRHVDVGAEVVWCRTLEGGWSLSGARFTDLATVEAASLLWARMREQFEQRIAQRYPFFRPITLEALGTTDAPIEVMGRDISTGGIGFIHERPLATRRVQLTASCRSAGLSTTVADVCWTRPLGDTLHVSGARFRRLMLDVLPRRR